MMIVSRISKPSETNQNIFRERGTNGMSTIAVMAIARHQQPAVIGNVMLKKSFT